MAGKPDVKIYLKRKNNAQGPGGEYVDIAVGWNDEETGRLSMQASKPFQGKPGAVGIKMSDGTVVDFSDYFFNVRVEDKS